MPLSVVVPAYDQAYSLELALGSLSRQTLPVEDFEIVIVDDCSTEDLAAVVDRFADVLDIQYLRNEVNLGRARTRNRGIAAARHDDLMLLDSDSYCAPDLLERHHRFADRPAGQILLGRRLEPEWDSLSTLARGDFPSAHSPLEQDPRYNLGFEPDTFLDSRTPWLFAYCNNMSVSRKLLDTVGGFNEDFRRWGYEDNELAYRIFQHHGRASGYFRYDADAVTYHLPHWRNWSVDWAGAQGYVPYMKERYRHFDVEFLGAPPAVLARMVPYYEQCLEALRTAGSVVPSLPSAGRELWFGFGVGRGCDHAAPVGADNLHLIGVSTPFAEGAYDRVVNVDLWRMLNAADMSALLLEGFRLAGEVTLVWSAAVDAPVATDLDYVVAMLRPHCRLEVRAGEGFALLHCRPLGG
ncbi:glycosyltransferase family 2 protein [Kutzneria chonburiensis]|uniref:Glycosyltransferase family 2 protein n=1 Tax=Kutzneria chonburiensis TaxID=1483604 RepID=A0ABV6MUD1_9PSEU|nr:glycosyltransferase [Kutzneria chonburiensis]